MLTHSSTSLRLRPLTADDRDQALAAHEELAAENFPFCLGLTDDLGWEEYVATLQANARGEQLPEEHVPSTFLVAVSDGVIVGRVSIRHELNAALHRDGGHIGYAVRPAHRRRGHATAILRQSLVVARSLGIGDVLLTCNDDNVGSVSVIERCGGELEATVPRETGPAMRRYWIR